MSGIFGSLFGKRKASQPADTSGRAAASSSRTGPCPSSWTGPPPRDPKEWRGPHNPTRSRGNADADDASRQPPVVDLTREKTDHPSSSSPRAARAAARDERRARRERRRDAAHDDGANPGETTNDADDDEKVPQDPVLVECTGDGPVQGVPQTDTVVDEDGDEANDFLYADPPPPSFAGFVDLTLEETPSRSAGANVNVNASLNASLNASQSLLNRCVGCGADVTGRPDIDAASWLANPGVGKWRGRCVGGWKSNRGSNCAVVLCGACLGERATRALVLATNGLARHRDNDGDTDLGPTEEDGGVPAIGCPMGCGGRLEHAPVAEAGDPSAYEAWATAATDALLGTAHDLTAIRNGGGAGNTGAFARCPNPKCGVAIEKVPAVKSSEGDLDLVAERIPGTGRWMSREALEHRASKLFRCGACKCDFCGDCGCMPYHCGFASCAAAAAAASVPKCRYCEERILPGASALDFYYFGGGHPGGGGDDDGSLAPAGKSGDMTVRELRRACGVADTSWCTEKTELRGVFRTAGKVCRTGECQSRLQGSCTKTLTCGHPCGGIRGETRCLPCLECEPRRTPGGGKKGRNLNLPGGDDPCPICYTEPIRAAPAILLGCGHVVHRQCASDKIRAGWPGPAISFNHLRCPLCGASGRTKEEVGSAQFPVMRHGSLAGELSPVLALRDAVMRRGRRRLLAEGNVTELQPGGEWEGRPGELALERFNYYRCSRCKDVYFGGARECGAAANAGAGEPGGAGGDAELICGGCSAIMRGVSGACAKHGREEMQFKCRWCCSPAVFYCFGTTHFCERCHVTRPDWKAHPPPKTCTRATCPLGVDHPPHGQEFCLGCALCRAADTGY